MKGLTFASNYFSLFEDVKKKHNFLNKKKGGTKKIDEKHKRRKIGSVFYLLTTYDSLHCKTALS